MYLALYRKYRPKTFDDVISQEHITTTLKNQIASATTAHAYLFTGSRGTGKTTCAKILAMAVNCLNPKDGNPCLECEACREIESGGATDIVEMDAASNNGVDDVRQLRDEVAYTPVSCKYRVYIIDEVHMLSIAAFNALLKTLEEPPEHVKFILATTELHKVPATILSRCQRFEFRRIDIADSAERLLRVAQSEKVSLDKDAAELISRLSDGGMRDALSVLDRCIAASSHVTMEIVRNSAGVADSRHLFSFSEMVAEKNVSGCIRLLNELHKGSKDIAGIVDELSGHYRDLMLYKTVPADKELLSAMPDEYPELDRICGMYSLEDILRCLSLLQQCADDIGKTKQRKTLAEMCFVKMCLNPVIQSPAPREANASAPAGTGNVGAASIVPMELPKEEFTPTPPEKMTRQEAETVAKLRELGKETIEIVKSAKGNAKSDLPEPIPVENSAPAMPDISDVPPPDSYNAPPDVFDAPPYFTAESEKPFTSVPREAPGASSDVMLENGQDKPQPIESITDEQWQSALEKIGGMNRAMLAGSSAETENGVLVIRSSSHMLNSAKDSNLKELEQDISRALGRRVRIRIAPKGNNNVQTEDNAVNRLLEKAKQLNIEVIYK